MLDELLAKEFKCMRVKCEEELHKEDLSRRDWEG